MNMLFKRIIYFPVTRIVVGACVCLVVLVGIQNLITKPVFYTIVPDKNIADTMVNYISAAVLLLSYFYFFRFYEKRAITELSTKSLAKELLGGFVVGFSVLSIIILMLYILGYYTIISISGFSFLLAPFSLLVVAALLEEIFFRAILYRIVESRMGTYVSLLIMSFLFEIPHLFNPHVTVLSFVFGLIFGFAHGIMYTYTKRIWLPFAFHLGWNFAQPFYGSNLSGMEDLGSVIKSKFSGPELLTGTIYGIEDSLFSIIFLAIVSFVFLSLSIRDDKIVKRKTRSRV